MSNFINKVVSIETLISQLNLKSDSSIYVQLGTIVDTSDEAHQGRVKVQLDVRGNNSTRWAYFLGYTSGQVPIEYVRNGTRVACIAAYGNAEELLILGTFGSNSSPNPISIPVLSLNDLDPLPVCNRKSLGQMIVLDNINGSDLNVCVKSGSEYSWRNIHASLRTENQGITNDEAKKLKEGTIPSSLLGNDYDPLSNAILPPCDASKQGQIIPFSERNEWRQYDIICIKDENQQFKWKPASSVPLFTRNTIPNCSEQYHGTVIQLDDGANSYFAFCGRRNGSMVWMDYGPRKPIEFNNASINEFPNAKNKAVSNPSQLVREAKPPKEEEATQTVSSSLENPTQIIQSLVESSAISDKTFSQFKSIWADEISKMTGISINEVLHAIDTGGSLLEKIEDPSNIPDAIKNIVQSNNALAEMLSSTAKLVSEFGAPDVSAVVYGVVSGGWQGGLDAATNYGLNALPEEFKGSFSKFIEEKGGIDSLPGPIKDIANSALGNINIGLKDVSKYILSGSLFNDLSNVNFDLSKLDLSINPDNIGNFLKSIIPGNIDLSGIKLDASTVSKSISGVLDYAGLGPEFSSLFSGGLGTAIANLIVPGINDIFSPKSPDPCSCENKKCGFKDPVEDGQSVLEDCKTVIKGMTTYDLGNFSIKNNNFIANSQGSYFSGLGNQILTPDMLTFLPSGENYANLSPVISGTQIGKFDQTAKDSFGANPDWDRLVQEISYSYETVSKTFKVTDNNITQLELTDKEIIDGILAIIKLIFGCGLPNGKGLIGEINGVINDFMTLTRALARITNILNNITRAGLGPDIEAIIDSLSSLINNLGYINDRVSSIACQIKADHIQPAKDINTALNPGNPGGSFENPFTKDELEKTNNSIENLSKENLIRSVFDGVPNPGVGSLPNRVSTLSLYPNKDTVDSILDKVFNNPIGIEQQFFNPEEKDQTEIINKILDGLTSNEENGRFEGEKDCR